MSDTESTNPPTPKSFDQHTFDLAVQLTSNLISDETLTANLNQRKNDKRPPIGKSSLLSLYIASSYQSIELSKEIILDRIKNNKNSLSIDYSKNSDESSAKLLWKSFFK